MRWVNANRLLLNPGKSQAIRISGKPWARNIPPLIFNGVELEFSESVLDLGMRIDCEMNWKQHARQVASKIFAGLRYLWPHAYYAFKACVRFVSGLGRYDSTAGHTKALLG